MISVVELLFRINKIIYHTALVFKFHKLMRNKIMIFLGRNRLLLGLAVLVIILKGVCPKLLSLLSLRNTVFP